MAAAAFSGCARRCGPEAMPAAATARLQRRPPTSGHDDDISKRSRGKHGRWRGRGPSLHPGASPSRDTSRLIAAAWTSGADEVPRWVGGFAPTADAARRGPGKPAPDCRPLLAFARGEGCTTAVEGFRGRALTWQAADEATRIPGAVGYGDRHVEVELAGPACKVMHLRMTSWEAVTGAVNGIRQADIRSEVALAECGPQGPWHKKTLAQAPWAVAFAA